MTPGDAELAVPPPLLAKRLRLHTQHQAGCCQTNSNQSQLRQ